MAKKQTPNERVSAQTALSWLERCGTKAQIRELDRYGITATRPFGVPVGDLKRYAKAIGRDHDLAQELWASGRYEARMLAAMIDVPERVTVAQMNRWASDFDNWALVDTTCFHLFDRTPHAWKKVSPWARARREFVKRAAFALLWSLSVHDKAAPDRAFEEGLEIIEGGAQDERHFVKKAVNMALRAIGKRNQSLNGAAIRVARHLSQDEAPAPRWIGSHALRELQSPAVQRRLR